MLKVKIWLWILEGPITNIYRENNAPSSKTPQPTRLTPQQLEEKKQKVYALIVITSTVRDISVVRRNYST